MFLTGCGADSGVADRVVVSPATVLVGQLQKQQFYATVYNVSNQVLTKAITWSLTGGIGTIDASGLLYAGSSLLSGTVVAQADSLSGSASVTITDKGSLSGRITDNEGNNCANITVTLNNLSTLSATSDNSGNYSIANVPPGSYEVSTRENLTYLSATKEASIKAGTTTIVNLNLSPRLGVSESLTPGDTYISVSVIVTNNGSTEVAGVQIIYIFYDADGSLVDSETLNIGNIAAGRSVRRDFAVATVTYARYTRTISATSYL